MNLRKTEIKFMGHIINENGLRADPEKVSAI